MYVVVDVWILRSFVIFLVLSDMNKSWVKEYSGPYAFSEADYVPECEEEIMKSKLEYWLYMNLKMLLKMSGECYLNLQTCFGPDLQPRKGYVFSSNFHTFCFMTLCFQT